MRINVVMEIIVAITERTMVPPRLRTARHLDPLYMCQCPEKLAFRLRLGTYFVDMQ